MAQYLNPYSARPFIDANGNPYSGAKLFTYVAGSTTKITCTKDSAGSSNHSNPIILSTRGVIADGSGSPQELWQPGGTSIKLVLAPSTDTDPPVSPIETFDNISGINDTTVTIDQWITGPTPTFVGATSFTLVGDQTSTFHIGRRIKSSNSGGTIYSTITNSVFGALTTVTVVNDSGVLDSGLSSVSYGLLSATNNSIPGGVHHADTEYSGFSNFSGTFSGNIAIPTNLNLVPSLSANALTIALKGLDGNDPSVTNPVRIPFRNSTQATGTISWLSVTSATSIVVSSGSTLGTTNAVLSQLGVVGFNDSSTFRLGVVNIAGFSLSDDILASSTAEGGAGAADSSGVIYTGTAVTSKPMKVLGLVESTQTTAGTWAQAISKTQIGTAWLIDRAPQGSSVVTLSTKTASASTNIIFTTADFDWTLYDVYEFDCKNMIPTADTARFGLFVSPDNGSNYANSSYEFAVNGVSFVDGSVLSNFSTGANTGPMECTYPISNTTVEGGASILIKLIKPSLTTSAKQFYWTGVMSHSSLDGATNISGGGWCQDSSPNVTTAAINTIKFQMTTNTIASGTITARAYKNS